MIYLCHISVYIKNGRYNNKVYELGARVKRQNSLTYYDEENIRKLEQNKKIED